MSEPKRPSVSSWRGRRVLIVGLGLHGGGVSAVRWFCRQGAVVRVTDTKSAAELAPSMKRLQKLPISWRLGQSGVSEIPWAEVVYQNQAVPNSASVMKAARRRGLEIVNETTLFFQLCPCPIIGVTGTRGKSTTTALIGLIMQQHRRGVWVSGNIRQQPMLDLLPRLRSNHLMILELSSFQLEFLAYLRQSPSVAVMTNIKIDHLNRYPNLAAYAAAKINILRWQKPSDRAVLNADEPFIRQASKFTAGAITWYSPTHRASDLGYGVNGGWIIGKKKRMIPLSELPQPGQHFIANALAAIATAHTLGVPAKTIRRALKKWSGLSYRQELIRRWQTHVFINDTTATTPDGTLAALAVYPRGVFIIGGQDKRLQFGRLADQFVKQKTPVVFLPGTATPKIIQALRRRGYHQRHHQADSMGAAVRAAVDIAKPGQAIVLSPGAASFGLFKHEFDRGDQFTRAVKKLP